MSTGPARRAGRTAALAVSVVGTAAQVVAHLAASSHADHGSDAGMLLAHVLAVLLTAGVLARRGAAVRRLAHLLDGLLPTPAEAVALPALDRTVAGAVTAPRGLVLVGCVLATARRRRGPPTGPSLRTVLA